MEWVNKMKSDILEHVRLKQKRICLYKDAIDSIPDEISDTDFNMIANVILKTFSAEQQALLEMRYKDDLTLSAIGKQFSLSKERIRQKINLVISKMTNAEFSTFFMLGLECGKKHAAYTIEKLLNKDLDDVIDFTTTDLKKYPLLAELKCKDLNIILENESSYSKALIERVQKVNKEITSIISHYQFILNNI